MAQRLNWFLDFDETLATSPLTWALKYAFPRLIENHQLAYDAARFEQAILVAQERSNQELDPRPVLHALFETLGWSHEYEAPLLHDIMNNYAPELFDDAVPFLEQARARQHRLYLVSNNPMSVRHVEQLGLAAYFDGLYTAKLLNSPPKPHRGLWDEIVRARPEIQDNPTIIVGDDPWSDGLFAENCGLPCWIIDRMNRFTSLHDSRPYRWAHTLLDIATDASHK